MILRGLVDFNISSNVPQNTINLNVECGGGLPTNLFNIPNGSVVTLQRGCVKRKVKVLQGDASECDFNFADMNPITARPFQIKSEQRFLLTFNEKTKVLRMFRAPVTKIVERFILDQNETNNNLITFTDGTFDRLGILDKRTIINVRRGKVCRTFRIATIGDIPDGSFRLTAVNARKYGLNSGKSYQLAYNQITNNLTILMKVPNS
ncbi:hypothetical protein [Paenibacillus eucommiae]|uniref:Uncharacterized protein n=1 Tax=Paenibacillus eucommiae TaxID=1355755 RepID=A0ABS4J3E8_9BACL|nr:hypothetical protein [Paenibacillus eucommiae]MBP1994372.1 hypothetical protein [Paenibacillus eucommiae]